MSGSVPTAEHVALTLLALAKASPVGISAEHVALTLLALAEHGITIVARHASLAVEALN